MDTDQLLMKVAEVLESASPSRYTSEKIKAEVGLFVRGDLLLGTIGMKVASQQLYKFLVASITDPKQKKKIPKRYKIVEAHMAVKDVLKMMAKPFSLEV